MTACWPPGAAKVVFLLRTAAAAAGNGRESYADAHRSLGRVQYILAEGCEAFQHLVRIIDCTALHYLCPSAFRTHGSQQALCADLGAGTPQYSLASVALQALHQHMLGSQQAWQS